MVSVPDVYSTFFMSENVSGQTKLGSVEISWGLACPRPLLVNSSPQTKKGGICTDYAGKYCWQDAKKKYHLDKFKTVTENKARGAEIIISTLVAEVSPYHLDVAV